MVAVTQRVAVDSLDLITQLFLIIIFHITVAEQWDVYHGMTLSMRIVLCHYYQRVSGGTWRSLLIAQSVAPTTAAAASRG